MRDEPGNPVSSGQYRTLVDQFGDFYDTRNPLPVVGSKNSKDFIISQDMINAWLREGRIYGYTTGLLTAPAGSNNVGLQMFNPYTSPVGIIILLAELTTSAGGLNTYIKTIQAPASSYTPLSTSVPNSSYIPYRSDSGVSQLASGTISTQNTNIATLQGSLNKIILAKQYDVQQLLSTPRFCPQGVDGGLAIYLSTASAIIYGLNLVWAEFENAYGL